MSKRIVLNKATRVEGNAEIHIQVEQGQIKAARLAVQDFRGFEGFMRGRRVESVPNIVSRICGLCCGAHQVASLKALEDAMGIEVPPSVEMLRQILVYGEWISSHALSYFFFTMPDLSGISGGIYGLLDTYPETMTEAFALRKAGLKIVELLGKRAVHPVALGLGGFLVAPTAADLREVKRLAKEIKERIAGLMTYVRQSISYEHTLISLSNYKMNFLVYDSRRRHNIFRVYDSKGHVRAAFMRDEFEDNVSEMRAEWSFAKFPFLTRFGFPEGVVLVGPLARSYQEDGLLDDPEVSNFELAHQLRESQRLNLEAFDSFRLLEIFWAAKNILRLIDEVNLVESAAELHLDVSGQGIGVVEAPRGVLMHSYLINRGCVERTRLLVATQFNNAVINLLIKDLAEGHLKGDSLTEEGGRLIDRCIRTFDPCLSCATH
jgi:coenzyme F420-reducing hydrogenase alpha subunit